MKKVNNKSRVLRPYMFETRMLKFAKLIKLFFCFFFAFLDSFTTVCWLFTFFGEKSGTTKNHRTSRVIYHTKVLSLELRMTLKNFQKEFPWSR